MASQPPGCGTPAKPPRSPEQTEYSLLFCDLK